MAKKLRGPRVDPADYLDLPLRAHGFLADVPLHDVWRVRLEGCDPGVTIREVLDRFAEMGPTCINRSARLLFALRNGLGRLFGWDRPDPTTGERSYLQRLTTEDRSRSLDEPGLPRGFWTSVYTFEGEAVGEVINRTVHAFLVFALAEAVTGDRTLFWGIYVKPVNRFTRFYMALIDPFRRRIIYPALVRRLEEAWRLRGGPRIENGEANLPVMGDDG